MSNLQKSFMKNVLPPMGPPPIPGGMGRGRSGRGRANSRKDYTPVSWQQYWDKGEEVTIGQDIFKVYRRGTKGPLLLLLHGGGYSALTWSLFAASVSEMVECQLMAFDQRGHGETRTTDDTDLSAERLASDVELVLSAVYGDCQPQCVVIGHSMGGAIAVHACHTQQIAGIVGLIVIDVVEGTAMDALASMQSFLRGRPQKFNSLQNAIEFSIRSGQTRNLDAARVSMPGQVKNGRTNMCGSLDVASQDLSKAVENVTLNSIERSDMIKEEEDETMTEATPATTSEITSSNAQPADPVTSYEWRINLGSTEKYWSGWFKGLSLKFLSCSPPKLLLLAGIDRLDTDLTVGQMQGKFQMQVLPQCGHAVHEDVPDRVAEVLATFLLRQRLTAAINEFERTFPAC